MRGDPLEEKGRGPTPNPPSSWPRMARHPWLVFGAWLVVVALAFPLALHVTRHLTSQGFEAPGSSSQWADRMASSIPGTPTALPTLVTGVPLSRLHTLAQREGLPPGWLHPLSGGGVALVPPSGTPLSAVQPWERAVARAGGHTTTVTAAHLGDEVSHDAEVTLRTSSSLALPILLVLLPLVFGALLQALLPLVTAAAGAELALAVIDLLAQRITLSVYLTDIVTFLSLGVGIDYALFITTRMRDALDRGRDPAAALTEAMATSGRSVWYSGMAVAMALATLVLGNTAYWRGLALGGAVAVACVLLATHTLLPALLRAMGTRIGWGRIPGSLLTWPWWSQLARWATDWPWLSVGVGTALLLVPAIFAPHLQSRIPANLARMLPRSSLLRQATQAQQQVLGPGSVAPMVVVMRLTTPVTQPQAWQVVARVTKGLRSLPGVASVASPISPGVPPAFLVQAAQALAAHPSRPSPLASFVAPHTHPRLVVLYAVPRWGPDQAATQSLLLTLRRDLPRWAGPGTRVGVGGPTALLHDFDTYTNQRLPWIALSVALVTLVVLFAATGSLPQAALGVLLDALVALATAGILYLVVQKGALGLEAQPPNLAVVPLVFVLLFGLSMDYEVILLHRIQEELHGGQDTRSAARRGIAATGGMITGAGFIMVVAFVVLLSSPLEVLQTLGLGMTAAILLDTWVVRTFLVPGVTVLLGRWAYWPWGRSPRFSPSA